MELAQQEERISELNLYQDENLSWRLPQKTLKGLKRVDKVMNSLCSSLIENESKKLQIEFRKNSYSVKGQGQGKGTQFSHPRMDFMCLRPKQAKLIKERLDFSYQANKNANFQFYGADQFSSRCK